MGGPLLNPLSYNMGGFNSFAFPQSSMGGAFLNTSIPPFPYQDKQSSTSPVPPATGVANPPPSTQPPSPPMGGGGKQWEKWDPQEEAAKRDARLSRIQSVISQLESTIQSGLKIPKGASKTYAELAPRLQFPTEMAALSQARNALGRGLRERVGELGTSYYSGF